MNKAQILSDIGTVLLKLRRQSERNLTQQDVADFLDQNIATYNRTESGGRELTIFEMFALAELYEISPTTILEKIQQAPADLSRIKQLQIEIEELVRENNYLREQLAQPASQRNNTKRQSG